MHNQEASRVSNTGRILCQIFDGVGHKTYIDGIEKDSQELHELFCNPETVVLFPSPNAIPICDLPKLPKHVIVIDGTWRQARRMNHRSIPPHVLRVAVDLSSSTLSRGGKFLLRRQRAEGRFSTIEAVCALLLDCSSHHSLFKTIDSDEYSTNNKTVDDYGDNGDATMPTNTCVESLMKALDILNKMVLKQSGRGCESERKLKFEQTHKQIPSFKVMPEFNLYKEQLHTTNINVD